MSTDLLTIPIKPDGEAFLKCLRREGTPDRVHYIELFLDGEVKDALCERFPVVANLDTSDPAYWYAREIAIQRFLGYDYVRASLEGLDWPMNRDTTSDTADLGRSGGRSFINEHQGPITNWDEFAAYPWPDPSRAGTAFLDWCERNLPDDMVVVASGQFAHFAEHLIWLMGYETICYAVYDSPDLVQAIADKLVDIYTVALDRLLTYKRVAVVWGSDDLGYRSGTLLSPADTRKYCLPGHKLMSAMAHSSGHPYLLHSCGNLESIMDDLINDVRVDAKHSFEDTIESVIDAKSTYGRHMALLGGIDVDFLCNANESQIRARVRETLTACMPGGGYCLGTGNSVANYIPLESYLTMLDEGRRF